MFLKKDIKRPFKNQGNDKRKEKGSGMTEKEIFFGSFF